ncbi:MAG: carbohydrate porin [Phycisphaerales bacterium]
MPRTGTVDLPPVDGPLGGLVKALNELHAQTGLRLGFAYTTLFQQAGGGPGDRNGFAGDVDLMSSWTLLGRGTKDTGTFVFTGENRFRQSTQPPSALGGVLGTLTNTTGGFNDRGWVVRDGFWLQRLFEDHVRLLVGRADPSDYVGGHRMQSINNSFLNRAFSANASVAYPSGHVPTAGISVLPNDLCYVTFGAANGYGTSNTINVDSLKYGDFFWFGEFGLTPKIDGLGQGRYRVLLWRMDAREEINLPQDQGISVILEQDFGDQFLAFARYSYSDADLTNIQNAVQGGVGYRGLLGSPDNLTGFAGSYAQPPSGGGRDETVFEIFQRWQLTRQTQFTLGAQLILNPSNSPTNADAVGVFEARLRVAF